MIFRILLVLMLLVAAPVSSFAGSVVYSYDELDRLHEATYDGYYKITYEYDELGNIKSRTVFPQVGSGSVSFQYGDGKAYYPSSNGWYTYWTPPTVGLATIVCDGAGGGGGGYNYNGDSDGGSGGFSAVAPTSTPQTYLLSAAGGSGGEEPGGDGASGDKAVVTSFQLSPIQYIIYVGKGGLGAAGDGNDGLGYYAGYSLGETQLYGGSGGTGGIGYETGPKLYGWSGGIGGSKFGGSSGTDGLVTISWSATGGATPLLIAAASIPPGASGVLFNQSLSATGGTAPYTWSVVSGSLPSGLSLNVSSGVIGGTPASAGIHAFTIQVSDNTGMSTAKSYYLSVTGSSIVTTSLVAGNVGTAYSQTLTATGGGLPYAWSVTSGTLPSGLSLNASSGVISGTPTTAGTTSCTVQLRDNYGQIVTRVFSMMILPPPVPPVDGGVTFQYGDGKTYTASPNGWYTTWTPPASIAVTAFCRGAGGGSGSWDDEAYYQSGANGGYSGIATVGGLSLGQAKGGGGGGFTEPGLAGDKVAAPLNLSAATAYKIYVGRGGAPGGNTAAPSYSTGSNLGGSVTLGGGATAGSPGANGSVTISWLPLPLAITTAALPGGVTGSVYSKTMAASGGVAPYTWSILAGTLPNGMLLNATTGTISGTTSTAGSYPLTLKVLDVAGLTATANLSILVSNPPLAINTAALPGGVTGAAYSYAMAASGGTAPYAWSILAGTLPNGLVLNATTGIISGTPSAAGGYSVTLKALDSVGAVATVNLSITVNNPSIDGFISNSGSALNPIWSFGGGYGDPATKTVTPSAGHLGNPALDIKINGNVAYSTTYSLVTSNRNVSSFWYRLPSVPYSPVWCYWTDGTGYWADDGDGGSYWEATSFYRVLTTDGVARQLIINSFVNYLMIYRSIHDGSYLDIHDYYDSFLQY